MHSTLPLGRGYTTLEIKVNYLRAVTAASGVLTAVGHVVHAGSRQAVAEARLSDEAGRLCATASTTCLLFDLPEARRRAPPASR
ncbi:PaaI family thioesterase, partial [Methylobacterium soli]|uniref:PaaI family thioesterase n=1 Tax=Methylobacterium soli TaxID=553447 RepID=UPI001EE366EA